MIQDGGSTDGTRQFLEEIFKDDSRVSVYFQQESNEKYHWDEASVRNPFLGQFETDWVLVQDVDELVSDNFWEWFKNVDHSGKLGYYIPHQNLWLNRDMYRIDPPWYPDLTMRLFKPSSRFRWHGAEHSSLWRVIIEQNMAEGLRMINLSDPDIGNLLMESIFLVHYHRTPESYVAAVMDNRVLHHSNEKKNFDYYFGTKNTRQPIFIRLRQHPTGAGLIKRSFEGMINESNN